jgi:LmbE family N-acetylglucosaminyl deacetylase
MHRVTEAGGEVMNVVVALGDVHFAHLGRTVTAEERMSECHDSMSVLGVQHCKGLFWAHDRKLDTLPLVEIIGELDKVQRDFRPTEILIPLPSSHQDHEITYRACLAATRPSAFNDTLQLIAAYEYPATVWGPGSGADAGKGGMYVELPETSLKAKTDALNCYRTQMREGQHCFSVDASVAQARMRGLECGLEYAELFHVMRKVVR